MLELCFPTPTIEGVVKFAPIGVLMIHTNLFLVDIFGVSDSNVGVDLN
jgi:hypothetical protein